MSVVLQFAGSPPALIRYTSPLPPTCAECALPIFAHLGAIQGVDVQESGQRISWRHAQCPRLRLKPEEFPEFLKARWGIK